MPYSKVPTCSSVRGSGCSLIEESGGRGKGGGLEEIEGRMKVCKEEGGKEGA